MIFAECLLDVRFDEAIFAGQSRIRYQVGEGSALCERREETSSEHTKVCIESGSRNEKTTDVG